MVWGFMPNEKKKSQQPLNRLLANFLANPVDYDTTASMHPIE